MNDLTPIPVEDLNNILIRHRRWRKSLNGGKRADLSRRDFARMSLVGVDLSHAAVVGANLRGCDLSEADLEEADLLTSDMGECKLIKARLTGADMRGTHLKATRLDSADLRSANLCDGVLITLSDHSPEFSKDEVSSANSTDDSLRGAASNDTNAADSRAAKPI